LVEAFALLPRPSKDSSRVRESQHQLRTSRSNTSDLSWRERFGDCSDRVREDGGSTPSTHRPNDQYRDRQGISLVYITPLRALNRDMLKRLQFWSGKLGFTVEVRHGDTPAADRRRMVSDPRFLITTPETLQAILPGSRMRDHLKHVQAVVVDEIHELAGERRGVQLNRWTGEAERGYGSSVPAYRTLRQPSGNPEEIASLPRRKRECPDNPDFH